MVNGRFVMLGTDNTEKSGLISAFYQQLSDHTVFTAQSQLSSPIQYTPFAGNDEISSMHTFAMCFENNAMVRIELTDFSEQFLNTFKNDLPEYSAYVNSIHSADVVYILIDGSHFLTDSIDMCVKNLKRKCARFITPLLASSVDLDEENSDDKLNQTIIFLVTKSQRLLPRYTPSDLNQILKQAFNNLFDIENQGHAEPYTVCLDTNYYVTALIPFLTGAYHIIHRYGVQLQASTNAECGELQRQIRVRSEMIDANERKNFLSQAINRKKIEQYNREIQQYKQQIARLNHEFSTSEIWKYLPLVRQELESELWKHRCCLVTDFTKGPLPIQINAPQEQPVTKTHPYLNKIISLLIGIICMGPFLAVGGVMAIINITKKRFADNWILVITQLILLMMLPPSMLHFEAGVYLVWIILEGLSTLYFQKKAKQTNKK